MKKSKKIALIILLAIFTQPILYGQENKKATSKYKKQLMGRLYFSKNKQFVRVPTLLSTRKGMYIHKRALHAFKKMHKAAKKEGIHLKIISAGRNFYDQKRIWEAKWNGKRKVEGKILNKDITNFSKRALFILRFSSMPGTSRHHWGSDIDLNSLNNSYFKKGKGKKVYKWLIKNGPTFGFCQPYTSKKNGRTGYQEEMWHWSYKPLAKIFLQDYLKHTSNKQIKGFAGSHSAKSISVIENYVDGVSLSCKK